MAPDWVTSLLLHTAAVVVLVVVRLLKFKKKKMKFPPKEIRKVTYQDVEIPAESFVATAADSRQRSFYYLKSHFAGVTTTGSVAAEQAVAAAVGLRKIVDVVAVGRSSVDLFPVGSAGEPAEPAVAVEFAESGIHCCRTGRRSAGVVAPSNYQLEDRRRGSAAEQTRRATLCCRHWFGATRSQVAGRVGHRAWPAHCWPPQRRADETAATCLVLSVEYFRQLEVHLALKSKEKKVKNQDFRPTVAAHLQSDKLVRPANVVTGTLGMSRFAIICAYISEKKFKKKNII